MKKIVGYLVSFLLGAVLMIGVNNVSAAPAERHPHIRGAVRELREAKRELQTAAHDFGGHRVKAIEAVDVAINQLEEALKFDK